MMVGLQVLGMLHLSCKTLHWHADRLCTADLHWQLPLSLHMLLLYYLKLTLYSAGQVTIWNW